MRLNFVVEGETEQGFVRTILGAHFGALGWDVRAQSIGGGRYRVFDLWRRDLRRWMSEDRGGDACFTTMLDLYALPSDFPDRGRLMSIRDPYERVAALEERWAGEVADKRFVPYIQLHEYEALLFADVDKLLGVYPDAQHAVVPLRRVVEARQNNPELIDDGPTTAPSKRIAAEIPAYARAKRSAGPLVAAKIGLLTLRERCRHFDGWLQRLEARTPLPYGL